MIVDLDFERIIADRSYQAQDFRNQITAQRMEAVIPPKRNAPSAMPQAQCPKRNAKTPHTYDKWLYRERHLIECFIGKVKHFRRVFSRFDKLAHHYLGFLHLVSVLIWLR